MLHDCGKARFSFEKEVEGRVLNCKPSFPCEVGDWVWSDTWIHTHTLLLLQFSAAAATCLCLLCWLSGAEFCTGCHFPLRKRYTFGIFVILVRVLMAERQGFAIEHTEHARWGG